MKVEGRLLQLAWPDGQVPHLLVAVTYLDGADRKPYIIPLHLPPITSNSGNSGEISGGTVVTKGVAMEVRTSMTGAVRLTREVGQGACVLLLPDGSIHSISSLAARGGSGGVLLRAGVGLARAHVLLRNKEPACHYDARHVALDTYCRERLRAAAAAAASTSGRVAPRSVAPRSQAGLARVGRARDEHNAGRE